MGSITQYNANQRSTYITNSNGATAAITRTDAEHLIRNTTLFPDKTHSVLQDISKTFFVKNAKKKNVLR